MQKCISFGKNQDKNRDFTLFSDNYLYLRNKFVKNERNKKILPLFFLNHFLINLVLDIMLDIHVYTNIEKYLFVLSFKYFTWFKVK